MVAARVGGSIEEANTIVASAIDICNGALYSLRPCAEGPAILEWSAEGKNEDVAVYAALSKSVFTQRQID